MVAVVNLSTAPALQNKGWFRSRFLSALLGVNPDDTYNETPYEKGFCFVSYLAHLVGDQGKFDAFLQVRGAPCWAGGCSGAVLAAGSADVPGRQ